MARPHMSPEAQSFEQYRNELMRFWTWAIIINFDYIRDRRVYPHEEALRRSIL